MTSTQQHVQTTHVDRYDLESLSLGLVSSPNTISALHDTVNTSTYGTAFFNPTAVCTIQRVAVLTEPCSCWPATADVTSGPLRCTSGIVYDVMSSYSLTGQAAVG